MSLTSTVSNSKGNKVKGHRHGCIGYVMKLNVIAKTRYIGNPKSFYIGCSKCVVLALRNICPANNTFFLQARKTEAQKSNLYYCYQNLKGSTIVVIIRLSLRDIDKGVPEALAIHPAERVSVSVNTLVS